MGTESVRLTHARRENLHAQGMITHTNEEIGTYTCEKWGRLGSIPGYPGEGSSQPTEQPLVVDSKGNYLLFKESKEP